MYVEMASVAKTLTPDPALQRAAVQVAALLPHELAEALAVLELAKLQVIEYFHDRATSSALAAG
jgi:hypothetical protein